MEEAETLTGKTLGTWRFQGVPHPEPGCPAASVAVRDRSATLRGELALHAPSKGLPECFSDRKNHDPGSMEAAAWAGDPDLSELSGSAGEVAWFIQRLESEPGARLVTLRERVRRDGPLASGEAARLGVRLVEVLERSRLIGREVAVGPSGIVLSARSGALGILFDAYNSPHWSIRPPADMGALPFVRDSIFAVLPEALVGKDVPGDPVGLVHVAGMVLYFALSGQAPGVAPGPSRSTDWLKALLEPAPPLVGLRADVDPGLATLVHRCLERDLAQRWPRDLPSLAKELGPFCS